MTTERDADAALNDAWFALGRDFTYTGPHDSTEAHAIVREHRSRIEAALRAQGDSASTPERIAAGIPRCEHGAPVWTCNERDSATTEGAVREAAAAYMAHVQALACDHGTNAGTHTSCPEALALRRALSDEREGAGS